MSTNQGLPLGKGLADVAKGCLPRLQLGLWQVLRVKDLCCVYPPNARQDCALVLWIPKTTPGRNQENWDIISPHTLRSQHPQGGSLRCTRRSIGGTCKANCTPSYFFSPSTSSERSWPRFPLTVPCNWAESESWCCWYLSATASALRSCVCSSK